MVNCPWRLKLESLEYVTFVTWSLAVGNCPESKKSSDRRCFSRDPMPWYDLSELISITNEPPVILSSVRVRDPLWRLNDPG